METEPFNKSKAMELPRNIVIGHDALHSVGEVCQSLKLGKKALLVADENTVKIAGKTVEKELAARKIRTVEFLIPDATWEEVRDGEERIRKGNFEFAVGVGGGSFGVDFVFDLIRGCNPAPGAWTTLDGKELQIFDARKHPVRTFGAVKGKIGEVVEVGAQSFQVTAQGGRVEVLRAKLGDGKKVAAAELLSSEAIRPGMIAA